MLPAPSRPVETMFIFVVLALVVASVLLRDLARKRFGLMLSLAFGTILLMFFLSFFVKSIWEAGITVQILVFIALIPILSILGMMMTYENDKD